MSNSLTRIMRDAIPYLRFETRTFELAFKKAYLGLLTDAEVSGYDLGVTSPEVKDDPYLFLEAVIAEMEDIGIDDSIEEKEESENVNAHGISDEDWPDED